MPKSLSNAPPERVKMQMVTSTVNEAICATLRRSLVLLLRVRSRKIDKAPKGLISTIKAKISLLICMPKSIKLILFQRRWLAMPIKSANTTIIDKVAVPP